jgi:hypothetical protein
MRKLMISNFVTLDGCFERLSQPPRLVSSKLQDVVNRTIEGNRSWIKLQEKIQNRVPGRRVLAPSRCSLRI